MAQRVKNLQAMQETWVQYLGQEDPLEKGMATHSIFLPGESHEQRSLVGCSPVGCKESDTTEATSYACTQAAFYDSEKSGFLKRIDSFPTWMISSPYNGLEVFGEDIVSGESLWLSLACLRNVNYRKSFMKKINRN